MNPLAWIVLGLATAVLAIVTRTRHHPRHDSEDHMPGPWLAEHHYRSGKEQRGA